MGAPIPPLTADTKIFLVGFMGAGKTTIGRMLAARLGWEFRDLDAVIEEEAGTTIVRIFAEKGEPWFRALEARALARLAGAPGRAVIACGGGTFCSPGSQSLMRLGGITVWIDQPFDQIWERRDALAGERPLLSGESELRALYDRRIGFYRLADLRVPVSEGRLPEAVEELVLLLGKRLAF